jgi:two-component system sensor histidine kinase and response regulator WspE
MTSDPNDLSEYSMVELYRLEAETQTAFLTEGLLALEADPTALQHLEVLMRAAHSLKGAARMIGVASAVRIAHVMEDCFVAAQRANRGITSRQVDILLKGVDLLVRQSQAPEPDSPEWDEQNKTEVNAFLEALTGVPVVPLYQIPEEQITFEMPPDPDAIENDVVESGSHTNHLAEERQPEREFVPHTPPSAPSAPARTEVARQEAGKNDSTRQSVRVTADHLNHLLAMAGEVVVASRWLDTYAANLERIKKQQNALTRALRGLTELLEETHLEERLQTQLLNVQEKERTCREAFVERLSDLESFDQRLNNLSQRLYQETLDLRMRPFADSVGGFPRMVRDIARELGKEVQLIISGGSTPVDRDVLERLEAPLNHLLRNSIDHGIESPDERERQGKPRGGQIHLVASHHAGMLLITITDDGRGIDIEAVRAAVIQKGLANPEIAAQLSEAELLEFLFLAGFTLKEDVTESSGRGVGLNAVQTLVKAVGGSVTVSPLGNSGTRFQLHLPLTLSVIRTLLVEVADEPYAFPLSHVASVVKLAPHEIQSIEGRQHFSYNGQHIGLVTAQQILELGEGSLPDEELNVVVLGNKANFYGIVVNRFLGERELVVRTLDPRLGKIQDISAAALMPDQSPVLIIDVDDLVRSIENLVSGNRLAHIWRNEDRGISKKRKRVLVVDDSLTVRELERKLIESKGYEVEVAVDGIDGWNAVRTGNYDLIVTDVDMPRMDGIELVTLIKKDPHLQALPVMIVSYKDREEDRRRGLLAGADYYLTKGSFHDATLLQAIEDLIGEAAE